MINVDDEMLQAIVADYRYNKEFTAMTDDEIVARIIELHEANKPKPEPVAFIIHSKDAGFWCVETLEEAERIAISLDGARFEPLYASPPTREPISNKQIEEIREETLKNGVSLSKWDCHFIVRCTEKAHGIGVEK